MKIQGRRLVLVPYPFQGHITPMLQLGAILHSKGFSITVAHSLFNSPNSSSHPDFNFVPLSDNNTQFCDDILEFTRDLNLACRAPFQEVLTQMIKETKEEQEEEELRVPCCIIYDKAMNFAEAVASHLKLPSIILHPLSATTMHTYISYPRLLEEGYIPFRESKLLDIVPGLDPLRFKDLPFSNFQILDAFLQQLDIARNIGTSSAIIWNSLECLEQKSLMECQRQFQVPIFSIGPMHKVAPADCSSSLLKEDTSCITWLDKQTQNSVLYVSFGSIASLNGKEQLSEMAWGLASSKQPFLWVLRPGSVNGSNPTDLLPDNFVETVGERGCIVKWASQKQVLAHKAVGGFWSHCGWNSTLESISEGVPMICKPSFGDQRVIARYVSHVWRVGIELIENNNNNNNNNALEREEIEGVIKRLMVGKAGEEMRQRALDLKIKIEISIGKGGSSHNSLNEMVKHIMSV